ncbi:hypothetical protein [Pseudomonas sp. TH31]|uniref:hypothetical protein n=1 Tax=Pseudomonas sp. TH31 TaxID=2796396 RepID=UPI00191252B7|nr:hypothetical protein [Pseudomonas sp. TH31]MBK5416161.1 hypothetical protein [Pseudomonas sp. TH31]
MVFHNIFNTAQNASQTGKAAGEGIAGYIPKTPAESICVPPHDPSQPFTPGPQDPKIVRETSPQTQVIFNFINALTQTMGQAAKQQDTTSSDPSTTINTASPIMSQADQITRKYSDDVPKPE